MSLVIPPPGWTVNYFLHADRDSPPRPAVVVDGFPNGVLRLEVLHLNGDRRIHPTAYHVDSRLIRDDHGAMTEGAKRNGTWDYHPWFLPKVRFEVENCSEPLTARGKYDIEFPAGGPDSNDDDEGQSEDFGKVVHQTANEAKEQKVIALIEQFEGDFDKVFAKAKFMGVSRVDLESLFQKHGLMPLPATSP